MPKLTDENLEQHKLNNGFQYSSVRIEDLGATEFSLVTLVNDVSSSVYDYADEMSNASSEVIASCQKSPRADNLLVRSLHFNQHVNEIHGFKSLDNCDIDDYKENGSLALVPSGSTALYDATINAVASTSDYAKNLSEQDFLVNGIIIIMTDGFENTSRSTIDDVVKALANVKKQETLESLLTILVGVGAESGDEAALKEYKDKVGLDQFINIKDTSAQSLAKLAKFVSSSISSQSEALGSGQASQTLTI